MPPKANDASPPPKPTFKHSLGKYPTAEHFDRCCSHDTQESLDAVKREIRHVGDAVLRAGRQVFERLGDTFPCRKSTGDVSDVNASQVSTTQRPMSVGDPTSLLPIGFELNELAQSVLESTIGRLITGSSSAAVPGDGSIVGTAPSTWAKQTEIRKEIQQRLEPFAFAAYGRHIGVDDLYEKSVKSKEHDGAVPQLTGTIAMPADCQGHTFVDVSNAIMVHIWGSADAAKIFKKSSSRMQQLMFEYRMIGQVSLPVMATFGVRGDFVLVVSLPPIRVHNTFLVQLPSFASLTQVSTQPSAVSLPGTVDESLRDLAFALRLHTAVEASVVPSADGRLYATDLIACVTLSNALEGPMAAGGARSNNAIPPLYSGSVPSWEVFERYYAFVDHSSHPSETVKEVSVFYFLLEHVLPALYTNVKDEVLKSRSKENQTAPALLRDNVLVHAMHRHGVPMFMLYEVWSLCSQEHSDESNDEAALRKAFADVAITEMVSRAAKAMVMYDIRAQSSKGFTTEGDQLDVVNRVVRSIAARDQEFWSVHLAAVVKRKFLVLTSKHESRFQLDTTRVHIASVLKVISSKTGAVLVPDKGRFDRYTSSSQDCVVSTWIDQPMPLRGVSFPPQEAFQRLYGDAQMITQNAPRQWRHLLETRAYAMQVMLSYSTAPASSNGTKLALTTFHGIKAEAGAPLAHVARIALLAAQMSSAGNNNSSPLLLVETVEHAMEASLGPSPGTSPTSQVSPRLQHPSASAQSSSGARRSLRSALATAEQCITLRQTHKLPYRYEALEKTIAALQMASSHATPEIVVCTSLQDTLMITVPKQLGSSRAQLSSFTSAGKAMIAFVHLCREQKKTSQICADVVLSFLGAALANVAVSGPPSTESTSPKKDKRDVDAATGGVSSPNATDMGASLSDPLAVQAARNTIVSLITSALQIVRLRKGIRSASSVMLSYSLAFFALQAIVVGQKLAADDERSSRIPLLSSVSPGAAAVRKIIDKTISISSKQQLQSAAAPVPSNILFKIVTILQRIGQDESSTSLATLFKLSFPPLDVGSLILAHVSVFGPAIASSFLLGRVGRGYLLRRTFKRNAVLKAQREENAVTVAELLPNAMTTEMTFSVPMIAQGDGGDAIEPQSPSSTITSMLMSDAEPAGRKAVLQTEIEERVKLGQAFAERIQYMNRISAEASQRKLLDDEELRRTMASQERSDFVERFGSFVRNFFERWGEIDIELRSITAEEEPQGRRAVVDAERKNLEFVFSMRLRSQQDAEALERIRLAEEMRRTANDSPTWERSQSPPTLSPRAHHAAQLAGDSDAAPRAPSPLLSGPTITFKTGREHQEQPLHELFVDEIEPLTTDQQTILVGRWEQWRLGKQRATVVSGVQHQSAALREANDAMQTLTDVSVQSVDSESAEIFEGIASVDQEIFEMRSKQRLFALKRIKGAGPSPDENGMEALVERREALWKSLADAASNAVTQYLAASHSTQDKSHSVVTSSSSSSSCTFVIRRWESRVASRLYLRSLRTVEETSRQLHLPCNQFATPIAFAFHSLAAVITATTVVPLRLASNGEGSDIVNFAVTHLNDVILLSQQQHQQQAEGPLASAPVDAVAVAECRTTGIALRMLIPTVHCLASTASLSTSDVAGDETGCLMHSALRTHVPDSFVFRGVDAPKRVEHVTNRAAQHLKRFVQRSGGRIGIPHYIDILHKSGVPLSLALHVARSEALKQHLSGAVMEMLLGTAFCLVVARAIKQLILATLESSPVEYSSPMSRLTFITSVLRTFSKSTRMLHTCVAHVLALEFSTPMAMMNISLISVAAVVRHTCECLGVSVNLVGGEHRTRFHVTLPADPVMHKSTVSRPHAYQVATTAAAKMRTYACDRSAEAQEISRCILVVQNNKSSTSALYAIVSKALWCDAVVAGANPTLAAALKSFDPLRLLFLCRDASNGPVDEHASGSAYRTLALLHEALSSSRQLVTQHVSSLLRDDIILLTRETEALKRQLHSPDFQLYRLALHCVEAEVNDPSAQHGQGTHRATTVFPILESLSTIFSFRKQQRDAFVLPLAQREAWVFAAFVKVLTRKDILPFDVSASLLSSAIECVVRPIAEQLLLTDEASSSCAAFMPLCEAAMAAVQCLLNIKVSERHFDISGDEPAVADRSPQKSHNVDDAAPEARVMRQHVVLLLEILFVTAKASMVDASDESSVNRLTMITLLLQDVVRQDGERPEAIVKRFNSGDGRDFAAAIRGLLQYCAAASSSIAFPVYVAIVLHKFAGLRHLDIPRSLITFSRWHWEPIALAPTAEDYTRHLVYTAQQRFESFASVHLMWLQGKQRELQDGLEKILKNEVESRNKFAEETSKHFLQREAELLLAEKELRHQIGSEGLVGATAILQHARDSLEWMFDTRQLQREQDALFLQETRERGSLQDDIIRTLTLLFPNFSARMEVLFLEDEARASIVDEEDERVALLAAAVDEDRKWMLELELGGVSVSPERRRASMPGSREGMSSETSRPATNPGKPPSRQHIRTPLAAKRVLDYTTPSAPLLVQGSPSPMPAAPSQDGPYTSEIVSDILGGTWQRVITPRSATRLLAANDEFQEFPQMEGARTSPNGEHEGYDDEDYEEEEEEEEEEGRVSPSPYVLSAQQHANEKRPSTPPQYHAQHKQYAAPSHRTVDESEEREVSMPLRRLDRPSSGSGLPPLAVRPGSGIRPSSSGMRHINQSLIWPAEYSDESLLEKMKLRDDERRRAHNALPIRRTAGTQTGSTPPPTPPTPSMTHAVMQQQTRPLSSGRPRSASLAEAAKALESTLDRAAVARNAGLLPAFDILYRSAQQQHFMGEALVEIFFMDIETSEVEAPQQLRFRIGSASRRREFMPSAAIVGMQARVHVLEIESEVHELEQVVLLEAKTRRRMILIEIPKVMSMLRVMEEEERLLLEDKEESLHATAATIATPVADLTRQLDHERVHGGDAHDEELMELKSQVRAYMTGTGPRSLRPAIAAQGVLQIATRRVANNKYSLGKKNGPQPASELLLQLQEELRTLDPFGERTVAGGSGGPVTPSAKALPRSSEAALLLSPTGKKRTLAPLKAAGLPPRGSSAGLRKRPPTPKLPYEQRTKLTNPHLPSILSDVLPDRDFSQANLPPLESAVLIRTSAGSMIPAVAHSTLDIAMMRQKAEQEIIREMYPMSDCVSRERNGVRPNSAGLKLTPLAELPKSLQAATDRSKRVVLVQSFLRAAIARRVRANAGVAMVRRWLRRVVRRLWLRRKSLAIAKLQRKCDNEVRRPFFAAFAAHRTERLELKSEARNLLVKGISDRMTLLEEVAALRCRTHLSIMMGAFRRLGAFRTQQRTLRSVDALARQCDRQLLSRYFIGHWLCSFAQQRLNGVERSFPSVDVASISKQCLPSVSYDNVRQLVPRLLPKWSTSPDVHSVLTFQAEALRRKNEHKHQKQFMLLFFRLYLDRCRRQERNYQLQSVILEKRFQLISQEVDRVWCIAMWSSGWARKYVRELYFHLYEQVKLKRPDLIHKKWKHMPPKGSSYGEKELM